MTDVTDVIDVTAVGCNSRVARTSCELTCSTPHTPWTGIKDNQIAQLEADAKDAEQELKDAQDALKQQQDEVLELQEQMEQQNQLLEDEKKKVEAEKKAVKAAIHDASEANSKARDLLEQVVDVTDVTV